MKRMLRANGWTWMGVLAVAALCAAPASAQQGPPPGRGGNGLPGCHDPRAIARFLHLSADQVTQTKALRQELKTAVDPLREELDGIHEQVGDLLDGDNPDACTVGGLVVQGDGLRDQIETLHDGFEADFRALLTPEQQTKWDALQVVCRAQGQPTGT